MYACVRARVCVCLCVCVCVSVYEWFVLTFIYIVPCFQSYAAHTSKLKQTGGASLTRTNIILCTLSCTTLSTHVTPTRHTHIQIIPHVHVHLPSACNYMYTYMYINMYMCSLVQVYTYNNVQCVHEHEHVHVICNMYKCTLYYV